MKVHGYKTKVGIFIILSAPFVHHFAGHEAGFGTLCVGIATSFWGLYWKVRRTKKVMKSA